MFNNMTLILPSRFPNPGAGTPVLPRGSAILHRNLQKMTPSRPSLTLDSSCSSTKKHPVVRCACNRYSPCWWGGPKGVPTPFSSLSSTLSLGARNDTFYDVSSLQNDLFSFQNAPSPFSTPFLLLFLSVPWVSEMVHSMM